MAHRSVPPSAFRAFVALLLLVCCSGLAAGEPPVVAVFDLDGGRLSAEVRADLADFLASELAANQAFKVVPRERVRQRLSAQRKRSYEDRYDETGRVALGKELAAQKSLVTKVMRLAGRCVVSARLYDLQSATAERAANAEGGCSERGLLRSVRVVATKLGGSMQRVVAGLDRYLFAPDRALPAGQPRLEDLESRTGAPYLVVSGAEDGEALPLERHRVAVNVAGVIAQVRVEQTYRNRGQRPIEAIYVFPQSTRAAVHGMRIRVGERVIEAQIDTREAARRRYEAARRGGHRAALLQQQRRSVLTMNVANIMPGERIAVELDYSELLVPEEGRYEFVYPAVVAPHYAGPDGRTLGTTHLPPKTPPAYAFELELALRAPLPIVELGSASHRVNVQHQGPRLARLTLDNADRAAGTRDVVVRYRLAGDEIASGVMLYEGADEKFFLAMIEPPRRPALRQVVAREYIFVVDVSGSMSGFPLAVSKSLLRDLLGRLRPDDRFNILLFASSSRMFAAPSVPASADNLDRALRWLDGERGGGGTELMDALQRAMAVPRPTGAPGLSRTVVVVTDGLVAVDARAFRFVRRGLGEANVFAFGIGGSVNRGVIRLLAEAGMGRPFVATGEREAREVAQRFRRYIEAPLLTGVRARFEGLEAYDVYPQVMPDLLAERPLVLLGKYHGAPRGTITISGRSGDGAFEQSVAVRPDQRDPGHAPLRVLWARRWADSLLYQHALLPHYAAIAQTVTNLGLTYDLVTPFTSFVAVDSRRVVEAEGEPRQVHQPLPQPTSAANGEGAIEEADVDPRAYRRGCGCSTHPDAGAALPWLALLALLLACRRRA